jgi:SNF2 family DNA or RNA helicase
MNSFKAQPSEATFSNLVNLLQTFMIRHIKSQRINGSEALSLPPSTTSTVMLTMSRDEDNAFNHINGNSSTILNHCANGVKTFAAERLFLHKISSYCHNREHLTKIAALRADLANLKRIEPNLRVVVYTQYVQVHTACVSGLMKDGFEVHQFDGSSGACQRDKAIRSFQNTASQRPAVFVITLKSGNVGITLTAASRIYLLEPCLDPSVEVQAAGRIHRLGQDKPCHVVKYAFQNSYESNIIKLHKEILEGRISIVDGFVPPEAMTILANGLRYYTPVFEA